MRTACSVTARRRRRSSQAWRLYGPRASTPHGPLPADTAFFLAGRGAYDLVVAMYHDQGHGPVKVLGLDAGVNMTVGLPVIRTSVDHGTAFDIAGTGRADPGSMIEALHQAAEMAQAPAPGGRNM
ncbi:4-hydroxythreonine-4-phosphate dehydrogenase PdxA [Streptomyces sp. NPDC059639]|uniref:4-hydroxythreonine-4-phosphate dehydrogenase PdxA n=1 Tax=Streptomyces sp. NPDC059639 TaxID=3346891 RepID=UPI0036BAE9F6